MVMSELSNGDYFKVGRVLFSGEIGKRISEMGFTFGTQGRVVRRALLGDPIEVRILRYNVSLRKAEADGIEVEKIERKNIDDKIGRRERSGAEKGENR